MKTILLVCTGNLCRSPMASALLQRRLADLGLDDQVQVESAGTWTREGQRATTFAQAVMVERGLSLEGHRSRNVTEDMLDRADLVLVMEEEQRGSLFHLSTRNLHKIYLLSEMSGGHEDVLDPFSGYREQYEQTVQLLDWFLAAGMPKILKNLRLTSTNAA